MEAKRAKRRPPLSLAPGAPTGQREQIVHKKLDRLPRPEAKPSGSPRITPSEHFLKAENLLVSEWSSIVSIIKNIKDRVFEIVGVVRTYTRSGEKAVELDVQIKTGKYFAIGRTGLRIDAPSFASIKTLPETPGATPVSAGYRSEGSAVSLMSEAARRSAGGGRRGPLVFTILPDLERQKKGKVSEAPPGAKSPDLAKRGAPADDLTLSTLKQARLLFAYRLTVAVRRLSDCHNPSQSMADAIDKAFDFAGLKLSVEQTLKDGGTLEKLSDDACLPHLQHRTERNLCQRWCDEGDKQRLAARIRELKEVLNLIEKAITAYTRLASGKRQIKQAMREGKTPSDAWVSNKCYGTPKQQEAVYLTFPEKMRLALYTGVNPSYVWTDSANLGDGEREIELFHGATLVARLGAGRLITVTTAELRPLAVALLAVRDRAKSEFEAGGVKAKSRALIDVHIMLRSIDDERGLHKMLMAIVEQQGMITIQPKKLEQARPLSSLMLDDDELEFAHDLPAPDLQQLPPEDMYWAREFWRPARMEEDPLRKKKKRK